LSDFLCPANLGVACVKEFTLTHNVSETGFRLRLQVEPTQLGPVGRASPYLRTSAPESESESQITTDGQSASLCWNKEAIWELRPDLCYCNDSYGFGHVGRSL
jgi:hypothetical protein